MNIGGKVDTSSTGAALLSPEARPFFLELQRVVLLTSICVQCSWPATLPPTLATLYFFTRFHPEKRQTMPNPHTKQDKKDHAGWIVTMFGHQNAPTHVMCRTCKQIKPRADFVYLMSRTQTKGLGKAGTARQAALSMFCDRCRPKEMRPVKSLPRGELLKHAAGGDIHPYIAQQVLRERRRSHAAKISAVQQKRWLKVYTDGWARPMYELRREIKWVQASIKRFTSPDWVLPEHKTLGHEAFLQTYHTELQAARSRYTLECRKPHHPDRLPVPILMPGSLPPSWYASLIPPARLAALTRMHKASATEINETYGPRDWPWTTSATSTS